MLHDRNKAFLEMDCDLSGGLVQSLDPNKATGDSRFNPERRTQLGR